MVKTKVYEKNTPSEITPPHCAHCLLWAMDDEDDELSTIQLDQKISPGILPSRWTPTVDSQWKVVTVVWF